MNDKETIESYEQIYDTLINYTKLISLLPLEKIDKAFDDFDTLGPILHPTLYREVLYSKKCKIIRKLIKAAIPLKREFSEAQRIILSEMETKGKIT
jgi:hypothetical protein